MAVAELRQRGQVKTLGERLRLAIDVRGVGVNELDEAIGRSRYVSKIVNDHRKPRGDVLLAIAKRLQIDPAWLVTGEGIAPTSEDDLSVREDAGPAPIWRRDPAWATERDLALARRADLLPERYIEEVGEMNMTRHRRPTSSLILRFAEACWLDDLAEQQRVAAAPQSAQAAVDSSRDALGPSVRKSVR